MAKPRRVLVIRNAYDKDCGGAEQYALNLCVELKNNGFSPALMTRVPDLISKAGAANIPVRRGFWHASQEWGKHYFLRFPFMVIWYIYIIVRHKFDIIHPQGRDDFIFASVAGGILHKRVVWTDHADLKYILDLKVHPFPYLRSWTIWAARFASHIICVSNAEKQKIEKNAPSEFAKKLITVHNGVFLARPKFVKRPDGHLIAANSRLVPDKGIRELLEMMTQLPHDTFLWVIGGHSNNEEMYTTLARDLGISNRVTFWGYVDRPDDYIKACDIFVHASYHEAFSLAIVEAAMLSKPIVATNVGGAPELIDGTCGILVPPKDSKALAVAVKHLLDNPREAAKLGRAVGKRARADFLFENIVRDNIIPLYR